MTLALSRIRAGSAPVRGPAQPGKTLRQRLAGPLKADHLRLYLGAALAIGLVGIGVNALLFQHERRPAPLFGSLLAPFSSPSRPPAAPPVPKPASVERDASAAQSPAALPPARPADATDGSPSASSDPITDLLRGEAHVDGAHLFWPRRPRWPSLATRSSRTGMTVSRPSRRCEISNGSIVCRFRPRSPRDLSNN